MTWFLVAGSVLLGFTFGFLAAAALFRRCAERPPFSRNLA